MGKKSMLKEVDSNPYVMDSNPDSNKFCSDGWIRIFIKEIRILSEEEVKLKTMDSNPRKMDSIPFEKN